MNILEQNKTEIIHHYKLGLSIANISELYGQHYPQRKVASIIAESEVKIEKQTFFVVPSKMNYDFKIVKDY